MTSLGGQQKDRLARIDTPDQKPRDREKDTDSVRVDHWDWLAGTRDSKVVKDEPVEDNQEESISELFRSVQDPEEQVTDGPTVSGGYL